MNALSVISSGCLAVGTMHSHINACRDQIRHAEIKTGIVAELPLHNTAAVSKAMCHIQRFQV